MIITFGFTLKQKCRLNEAKNFALRIKKLYILIYLLKINN